MRKTFLIQLFGVNMCAMFAREYLKFISDHHVISIGTQTIRNNPLSYLFITERFFHTFGSHFPYPTIILQHIKVSSKFLDAVLYQFLLYRCLYDFLCLDYNQNFLLTY